MEMHDCVAGLVYRLKKVCEDSPVGIESESLPHLGVLEQVDVVAKGQIVGACDLGIRVVEECDDLLNIERSIDNAAQSNLNLLEFDERLRQ